MKHRVNGPSLLLGLAFLLAGAKSPLAFCGWSMGALIYSAIQCRSHAPTEKSVLGTGLFAGAVILSQIYSPDPTHSLFWTTQYLVFAYLWLALQTVHGRPDSSAFWNTLFGLGLLSALWTTVQWIQRGALYGTLPLNPNFNAVWMAALAIGLLSKRPSSRVEFLLILWLAALVVFGHSRSGLLALGAGTCYALSDRYSWRTLVLAFGLLALLGTLVPHAWLLERLNVFEQGGRLRIWGLALRSAMDFPLTGYGPGNFELAYLRHAFPIEGPVRYARTTAFAHNDYLQLLCELGWPGALLVISGFFHLLLKPIGSGQPLARTAKAILITLATAACFNPIFKMPILTFLALLCSAQLLNTERGENITQASPHGRAVFQISMSLLMLLVFWGGIRAWWARHGQWARIASINSHDAEAWHELAYRSTNRGLMILDQGKAFQESPGQLYDAEALARTYESLPGPEAISQAVKTYLAAIELAPTRATNYLGIARLLWRAGEPSQALLWIHQARTLEPCYWECDLWKARCLFQMGRTRQAVFTLKYLAQRRRKFRMEYPTTPDSPYENAILDYDEAVVHDEAVRFSRLRSNGVQ